MLCLRTTTSIVTKAKRTRLKRGTGPQKVIGKDTPEDHILVRARVPRFNSSYFQTLYLLGYKVVGKN